MASFSPAVGFAHKIAAVEAKVSQHATIEMEDLLAGICRALSMGDAVELKSKLPGRIRKETSALRSLLTGHGVDQLQQPRVVRLGPDPDAPASRDRKVHRSPGARRVFERAGELVESPTGRATLSHLLAALMDEAEELFRSAVAGQDVDLSALRAALAPLSARNTRSADSVRGPSLTDAAPSPSGHAGGQGITSLPLRAEVSCREEMNFASAYCGQDLVSSLTLTNEGDEEIRFVEIRLHLGTFGESKPVTVPLLPAGEKYTVPGPFQFVYSEGLLELGEPVPVPLEVRVNERSVRQATPKQVLVLPARAWNCLEAPEALAVFILKECDEVNRIIRRVTSELRCLFKGLVSFEDVLGRDDPEAIPNVVKAIYFGLQERYLISYGLETRYYAPHWQGIRCPARVIRHLEGTCVDLALLFASCLENRHLDPVVVVLRTGIEEADGLDFEIQHALVGCWLRPVERREFLVKDAGRVLRWVESGKLLLLDPVGFAHGSGADLSFSKSRAGAEEMLARACAGTAGHDFRFCLDVFEARQAGIEPLPIGFGIQPTRNASQAMAWARREAERLGTAYLGARHLLLALLKQEGGPLHRALGQLRLGLAEKVKSLAERSLGVRGEDPGERRIPLRISDDWKAVERAAREEAKLEGSGLLREAHLLRALFAVRSQAWTVFDKLGVDESDVREILESLEDPDVIASDWHSSGFAMD